MSANTELNRRTVLKMTGAALGIPAVTQASKSKSVIVIGAGIAGLSCAYELVRRGHDVTVLEASGRPGGHVRTFHDPFADGLYADIGAEHFYYPGYTQYWRYVNEFGLTAIHFPRRENMTRFLRGERFSEAELHSRQALNKLGFNQRESEFLADHPWADLQLLYLQRYVDQIHEETNPFASGLTEMDSVTIQDLLKRENASGAAVEFFGGSSSALQVIWNTAIKRLRGTDLESKKLFRLKGGNQLMTDAFAARLKEKIHLGCPASGIEQGGSGVTVKYRESGQEKSLDADYLVSCISLVMLRQLPVTPAWPEAKAFVIREMPYYTRTRLVFQCRTRFWERDGISPNALSPDPRLNEMWTLAEEVKTERGILIGGGQAGVSASAALAAFTQMHPGKDAEIEQTVVHDWSKEPWSAMCERIPYRLGELSRFWPEVIRPCGRVHFAGAYAAPMNWGQEAALESANRVAESIHVN
jgi:monoamine oxidase